jgi:hypothetical protein
MASPISYAERLHAMAVVTKQVGAARIVIFADRAAR